MPSETTKGGTLLPGARVRSPEHPRPGEGRPLAAGAALAAHPRGQPAGRAGTLRLPVGAAGKALTATPLLFAKKKKISHSHSAWIWPDSMFRCWSVFWSGGRTKTKPALAPVHEYITAHVVSPPPKKKLSPDLTGPFFVHIRWFCFGTPFLSAAAGRPTSTAGCLISF